MAVICHKLTLTLLRLWYSTRTIVCIGPDIHWMLALEFFFKQVGKRRKRYHIMNFMLFDRNNLMDITLSLDMHYKNNQVR